MPGHSAVTGIAIHLGIGLGTFIARNGLRGRKHYLLTTDADFNRVAAANAPREPAVQVLVQQRAENR